jgi:bisphosphoglycerate-independent phosphoglycerate mutase (AlkP superfamily)
MRAGPVVSAMGAGLLTRDENDLRGGAAVASEIVNTGWRERLGILDLPVVSAAEAGAVLASIANEHDITLFAHYATDGAGHDQDMTAAANALALVDQFVRAVHSALDSDVILIIASDHGNIEDVRGGHTRNPALGVIAGRGHEEMSRGMASLMDVAPLVMRLLEI